MRGKTSVVAWSVAVVVVIAIIVAAWYVRHGGKAPAVIAPVAKTSAPVAPPAPVIAHPITKVVAPAAASTVPLPTLDASDADVTSTLARLTGDAAIGKLLARAHIIQRIVATVDALPRRELGDNILPLQPPAGSLGIGSRNGQLVLASANAARYAPYMAWVRHADVPRLVAAYVHYYPLFQQAYRELGYPDGHFNDRLVAVIDNLLAAPEPHGPLALVRTDKGYDFADPSLEALSAGQKLMLRVGPANEKLLKQKLRELRAAVAGQQGPTSAGK
ncbi:MAG TPA: DUF3014 domain-containing protein [Rhodanobacteraceae bacterium]